MAGGAKYLHSFVNKPYSFSVKWQTNLPRSLEAIYYKQYILVATFKQENMCLLLGKKFNKNR